MKKDKYYDEIKKLVQQEVQRVLGEMILETMKEKKKKKRGSFREEIVTKGESK